MRRLSKTAWIVLGVGIFIIAFAALYLLYYQQGRQQSQLEDSLVQAQATRTVVNVDKTKWQSELTELEGELAQLNTKLAQARARLSSSKGDLPSSVESIEYDEMLFEFAQNWGLQMSALNASTPGEETIEGITFTTTGFTVNVKGAMDDILSFIGNIIAHPDFASATVESVNLAAGIGEEEAKTPSADIKLVIYSYQGD